MRQCRLIALLCVCFLCPAAAASDEGVHTVPDQDWSRFGERLTGFGRKLKVALPCCGIDGCLRGLQVMDVPCQACNVFDLEPRYAQCLEEHFREMGMEVGSVVPNLGKIAGNLLRAAMDMLDLRVDLLCAGPPCPPWAGNGNRNSLKDKRADVFLRVICWVVALIKAGGLLATVLEPVMNHFLRVVRNWCPEFHWDVSTLALKDYMCAQTRVRVFLKGVRKTLASCVPKPLAEFGKRSLAESLGKFPNMVRSSLTWPQECNLLDYESKVRDMHASGKLSGGDLIVISVRLLVFLNAHSQSGRF